MRISSVVLLLTIPVLVPADASAGAICRNGSVLPAVIRKAAAGLPVAARLPANVGARLATGVRTAPLPVVLGQILPQYPGYQALRTRRMLAVVDPRSRRIAYLLPLDLPSPLDCPDS